MKTPIPPRSRRGPAPGPRFVRSEAEAPRGSESWTLPWVQLRTFSFHPCLYPAMIKLASPEAKPGDLVAVYDKEGRPFGAGLYNPQARVPLRMVYHGPQAIGEDYLQQALASAIELRQKALKLEAQANAYRVVNSDGDGLSGLTVDRYADVLSVEVHSLGIYQRLPQWLPFLHQQLGTQRALVEVGEKVARLENIPQPRLKTEPIRPVRIRENGVRFEVDFQAGHKTGFFCDQRENRAQLARLAAGKRLLDLCCYTGGFAIAGAVLGPASEVTGVDLDETAIEQARRNGNLNQQNRIRWVHADAFAYARQMQQNGEQWDIIVVDPPKLVENREEELLGRRKYEDLNGLAMRLLPPGGFLVTCSCSGLLSAEAFEGIVVRAAQRVGRRLQFFDRTGAGPDHPVMSNCPESRYLKVLWARVM